MVKKIHVTMILIFFSSQIAQIKNSLVDSSFHTVCFSIEEVKSDLRHNEFSFQVNRKNQATLKTLALSEFVCQT